MTGHPDQYLSKRQIYFLFHKRGMDTGNIRQSTLLICRNQSPSYLAVLASLAPQSPRWPLKHQEGRKRVKKWLPLGTFPPNHT